MSLASVCSPETGIAIAAGIGRVREDHPFAGFARERRLNFIFGKSLMCRPTLIIFTTKGPMGRKEA